MFFPASVTIARKVSKNAHHVVSYGTPATLTCKYQEVSQKIINNNNQEVVASAWLMFPAGTSIGYDDKITLPSGATPFIASIATIRDHMNRAVCVEVYLSKSGGGV